MTNRQFDKELRNSKAEIDKSKFQHKNWLKRFPNEMKEAGDDIVRAIIQSDSPLWGSMSLTTGGRNYRIG